MREMKDSGIELIESIPNEWNIIKTGYLFRENVRPSTNEDTPLSLSQVDGLIATDDMKENSLKTASYEGWKRVKIDDLVLNRFKAHLGVLFAATLSGKVSFHYGVYEKINDLVPKYFEYLYHTNPYRSILGAMSNGMTVGLQNLSNQNFYSVKSIFPPISEQAVIVDFLDEQCAEIDSLISDIQSQIEVLEEYKKALVFRIISRGIKKASLKSTVSDVWTAIPETWELIDIKYVFEIVKRIAGQEGFDVLSVTQKGLKVKDIESNNGQQAESYAGYQFVYPTDYVMNHMDLLTGWVDCSTMFGVTSPDYRVFRLRDKENNDLTYFKYVMQCCYMSRIFYSLGQGVSNLGRWRLQTSAFNNFMIPVPPLEEQREIAEYLDTKISEIDIIIADKQKQIDTIEEYKKSLIFEYVTGKKEVPIWK